MPIPMRAFAASEDGAVTTDWAVLTASAIGVGVVFISIATGGVENLANDTSDILAQTQIATGITQTASPVVIPQIDSFDSGSGNWSGATAREVVGFGNILGPIAGTPFGSETVSQSFSVPPDTEEAVFAFDLLAMDSLDGDLVDRGWGAEEGPVVYVDGEEIARARAVGGELIWTIHDNDRVEITAETVRSGENIGGPAYHVQNWHDGVTAVEVTVTEPGDTVDIGFGLQADQGINDESIGIDNFVMTAS